MRLLTLGILNLYKSVGTDNALYIMRYDIVRDKHPALGHGFYLYNFSRIPAEFECLFIIHYPIVKESVVNE